MDTDTDLTATDALEAAQVDAVERGGATSTQARRSRGARWQSPHGAGRT